MDKISYEFIEVEIPDFSPDFFDLWLNKVVRHYNRNLGELTYIFCSDDYLFNLNKDHLGHSEYTDVITFNYNEETSLNGDIYISFDRIKQNSEEFGNGNVMDELCRVMVHGVLHLIGFNDKKPKEIELIRTNEDLCLNLR